MSGSFALAACGSPAADLPAYPLAEPVASWLTGYLPQMAHWTWSPRPDTEPEHKFHQKTRMELRIVDEK
jgi:beta-glucosidase